MAAFSEERLSQLTLRLFMPLSVAMAMIPKVLRKFRRLLQIKKIIKNAPYML